MKNKLEPFGAILKKKERELKENLSDKGERKNPVFECPKCRDVGAIFVKDEDGYELAIYCECHYAKNAMRAKQRNGVTKLFEGKTLDTFLCDTSEQKLAKKQARKYLDTFSSETLVCGNVGSGKTHIAVSVVNELEAKGIRVMFMDYVEMIHKLDDLEGFSHNDYLTRIKDVELLVIDDLLKTGYSVWNGAYKINDRHKDMIYKIINYRYNNKKPMIVTTELNIEKMLLIDPGIGSRMISMARDNVIEFDGDNDNYRLFGE